SAPGSRVQGAAAPGRVQGAEPLAGVELWQKRNNRNVGGRDAGEWDNSRYNCNINMRGQRYENVGNDRRGKRSYVDVVNGGYKRGGDGSKNKMVNEDNGYKEKVKEGLEKQWMGRTIEAEEITDVVRRARHWKGRSEATGRIRNYVGYGKR
ncbi:hypothetical protein Tco_0182471, partial [Tanacetum coccineum]